MRRNMLRLTWSRLLAAGLLASCAPGETAMEQAVLFSAIEGQVVRDGQPLAGATLTREWDFAEDRVRAQDTATTDAQGRFGFAAVLHPYRKSRFLAQQPIVSQLIKVAAGGSEWRVWAASKHDLKAGSEAREGPVDGTAADVPLQVTIDLDTPKALRGKVVGHTLFGGQP